MKKTCNKCGAPIEFVAYTNRGGEKKKMPCDPGFISPGDAEPDALFVNATTGRCRQARHIDQKEEAEGDWHLSHFATCPEAEKRHARR